MFFQAILQNDRSLDEAATDSSRHLALIQKLLALSVIGMAVHGLVLGGLGETLLQGTVKADGAWIQGHPMAWMPLALVLAFLGALVICLPSFYFYTQLAGMDAPAGLIVVQSLRVMARTGALLLGIQPFFVALALGVVLGLVPAHLVLAVGLVSPFVVGLAGIVSLYRSFKGLVKVVPITHARRGDMVLRFVLAWGGLYLTVAPVALWKAGAALGQIL